MTPFPLRRAGLGALLLALSTPGLARAAEPAGGDLIIDARLRAESVSQDGFAEDAQAITLRTRLGYETPAWSGFRLLVEGEAVTPVVEDYNSTTNGKVAYPVVADPDGVELNRAQVSWASDRLDVVAGRQRLILGNARFVGNVGFRQNEQTFDAVKAVFRPAAGVTLTGAWVGRVHRIFGDDSPQGEWDGDAVLLQAEVKTPLGPLSGYGYLMDFDNAPAQSNATFGARLTGAKVLRPGLSATYEAEYARQTEYGDNPTDFDLNYVALAAGLKTESRWASIGLERLDGDGVRGFATPLATLHAFQGWADVFLNTPAAGVRDLNLRAGATFKVGPGARPVKLAAAAHDFTEADSSDRYGREFDLVASTPITRALSAEVKAAWFDGDRPGFADRTKVWFTLEFKY